MTDEYKFEATQPTVPYGNVKVRAHTVDELLDSLNDVLQKKVAEVMNEIATIATLNAGGISAASVQSVPVAAPGPQTPAAAAPPAAAAGGDGFQCNHGARIHRTGQSAKGPWSAWFCPQPKGASDACPPVWK